MNKKTYTTQNYWNNGYKLISFKTLEADNIITSWISKHIPDSYFRGKKVFEVGCFPGGYLEHFGQLGSTLFGIDYSDRLIEMKDWLISNKVSVGNIINKDFFKLNSQKKYDVVCSFGFIEHFDNWVDILIRHDKLLKKDGILIITCPNFSGKFQLWFHSKFDVNNLGRHNIRAMNLNRWLDVLNKLGYTIIAAEAYGGLKLWYEDDKCSYFNSKIRNYIVRASQIIDGHVLDSELYSPVIGIIAKK